MLKAPLTQQYLAFCAFASQDFQTFLLKLQYEQPMIRMLYTSMEELLSNLMQKFVAKAKLFESNGVLKPTAELIALDVNKKVNLKSLKLIEIGTKARALFASNL